MRKMMLLMGALALGLAAAKAPKPVKLPKGPGREIVQAKCSTCHQLPVVTAQRKTQEQWETSLDNMVNRGMEISDGDFDLVAGYLAKNFGVGRK